MSVAENIRLITGTLPPQVVLVAVSKTKPVELLQQAYDAGQRDFGENYVQELCAKYEALPRDIRWHFIGHLQTNKVKYIAPFVHLIHGVDGLKLLKEIDRQAARHQRVIQCLLQIHIATEETKFGLSYDECEQMLGDPQFTSLRHVKVIGLMGMASNTGDQSQVRQEFASLKKFFDRVSGNVLELSVLSCGMSQDYRIAIEQGSTMVRIGSTIFGERNYEHP